MALGVRLILEDEIWVGWGVVFGVGCGFWGGGAVFAGAVWWGVRLAGWWGVRLAGWRVGLRDLGCEFVEPLDGTGWTLDSDVVAKLEELAY